MKADWLQLPDTAGDIPPRRHHRRLTIAVLLGAALGAAFLAGWTSRALASAPRSTMTAIPTPAAGESDLSWSTWVPNLPTVTARPWPAAGVLTPRTNAATVSGIASWFATGPDGLYAAAGPALRRMLGPKWRGRYVTVSAGGRSIRVRLNDWMRADRLLDLSDEAFSRLAPLSRGLVPVMVWVLP